MQERPDFPRASGFTLIELLLAVAIATLVAALAWSLLSTTTRTVTGQVARAKGPQRAARAMDILRADLMGLFLSTNDEACALTLQSTDEAPFSLSFCMVRATNRTPDLVWAEPLRVEYAVVTEGGASGAWVRVERSLSGPVRSETNILMERVSAVRVEFSDGAAWTNRWPDAEHGAVAPRAARVQIRARDADEPIDAEYWIPAGNLVTSQLLRTSAQPE